jgi:hypothetical protein
MFMLLVNSAHSADCVFDSVLDSEANSAAIEVNPNEGHLCKRSSGKKCDADHDKHHGKQISKPE